MRSHLLAVLLVIISIVAVGFHSAQASTWNQIRPSVMPPSIPCLEICPGPPCAVDDPCNVWAPYGPIIPNLKLQYYFGVQPEYQAFLNGQIDVMDTTPPACKISCLSNPDLMASPPQGGYNLFGIFFNAASSTWKPWGCDWNTGTPFTNTEQTYVTQCGINMRQAFAHLVDRPSFAARYGGSTSTGLRPLADPSPMAKDPSSSNATTQCSWDPMFPNCQGAYRIQPSPSGFAQAGSPDFCAAADHLIAAGIATGKLAGSCILTGVNPGVFAHPIRFYINIGQVTYPARKILGDGLTMTLNLLFGGRAVAPQYCDYSCYSIILPGPSDTWDAYTFGYILGGPYVDQLSGLFYSQQASNYCGGPFVAPGTFLNNPSIVCVPALDKDIKAANTTASISVYGAETLAAFNDFGKRAIDFPVYSSSVSVPALRAVDGLVNQRGIGYSNLWTMLNGKPGSYVPANPIYSFGGGDPTTLRWGQAEPTFSLNVFNAQSLVEFNTLNEIYDTLFIASPVQPGKIFCWMCDTYSVSADSRGNELLDIQLRQNIRWQDSLQLDARDVKFSLLNLRDFSGSAGAGLAGALLSVTIVSPTELLVLMNGQNVSNLFLFSTVPIIPRHLWELSGDKTYGDVGVVDPAKVDFSYDPIAFGTLIGSGPFVCRSLFQPDLGRVGTGCAANSIGMRSGQELSASITLQKYDLTSQPGNADPFYQYMRSYNPAWSTGMGTASESGQLQEFRWADRYDNATVTVRDLVSVAACYGKTAPDASCSSADFTHWLKSGLHPNTPNTISSEVAIVSSHLDDTWIYPFSWSGNQSAQPGETLENIVPFPP